MPMAGYPEQVRGRSYCYDYINVTDPKQALKTMNIVIGMFLADLHVSLGPQATSFLPTPAPILLLVTGLYLCGYPQDSPEWTPWSEVLRRSMFAITPPDADIRRYWDSIGASLVILGLFFSDTARRILSSRICNFLGYVSFPVYLLHNTLIKTVLTWMVYFASAMKPTFDDEGERIDLQRCSKLNLFLAVAVYFALLYRLSYWWAAYVDSRCARWVSWAVNKAYGDGVTSDKEKLLLLA